jgi:hypothetical protein
MANNLDQIVDCLRQLQPAPAPRRSVALGDEDSGPGYVYVSRGSQPTYYAEALADPLEADTPREAEAAFEGLDDLGWNPPLPGDSHWYRSWAAQSEADQLSVALQIQQTLEAAYGIPSDQPLSVRFASN